MGAPATKLTAKQYFEVTVEGDRTQLVDGALVVNEPKPIHNALQARFVFELTAWVRQSEGRGLALTPTDIVMDEHNVFGPDVLWIAEQHRPTDLSSRLSRVPDTASRSAPRAPGATTSGPRRAPTSAEVFRSCG